MAISRSTSCKDDFYQQNYSSPVRVKGRTNIRSADFVRVVRCSQESRTLVVRLEYSS